LRNSLRTASGKNMKPYDLRHLGIIFAVGDQIGKRLATGNFGHALANLSVQVGHGSLTVTLATYVGTAVFVLM
jgi:hypothetical protein